MSADVVNLDDERSRRQADADPIIVFSLRLAQDGNDEIVYATDCSVRDRAAEDDDWWSLNLAKALREYADRISPPPAPAQTWSSRAWSAVHNLVAHPLLVLCPPLGEWLHDVTARRLP